MDLSLFQNGIVQMDYTYSTVNKTSWGIVKMKMTETVPNNKIMQYMYMICVKRKYKNKLYMVHL